MLRRELVKDSLVVNACPRVWRNRSWYPSVLCQAERWHRAFGCDGKVYGDLDEGQWELEVSARRQLRPSMRIMLRVAFMMNRQCTR